MTRVRRPSRSRRKRRNAMQELLEAIQRAVAEDASAEQKAAGAQACRTILTALEAEPGKPLALPSGPAPQPLAGIDPDQALDLTDRAPARQPAGRGCARAEGSTPGDIGPPARARPAAAGAAAPQAMMRSEATRARDVRDEADHHVAVSRHPRGRGVPQVPIAVRHQERRGAGMADAERDRPAADASLHEGGAASLCCGEGDALPSASEWDAWRERGAR